VIRRSSQGLSARQIAPIIEALGDKSAILVGGQAIFVWSKVLSQYAGRPAGLRPVTSRDVDYFGSRKTAQALASALRAEARYPDPSDVTPSTALVLATIGQRRIVIDFLSNVFGVPEMEMRKRAMQFDIGRSLGVTRPVVIRLLHPIHCLMSRTANVVTPAMRRRDPRSMQQLRTACQIVRAWIRWRLADSDMKEATRSLRELFEWLRGNEHARDLHRATRVDPLGIIRDLAEDSRWHKSYREKIIAGMIREIERRREIHGRRQPRPVKARMKRAR